MASTKKAAPTDEELSAMFEGIGADDSTAPAPTPAAKHISTTTDDADADGVLAELKNLATAPRTSTSSRPETPRLASSVTTSRARSPGFKGEPFTPTTGSGRSSEEKAAAEAEATRQGAAAKKAEESGGSWWGGFSAIASAAVKQAGAAVAEIQKNEEAQKWADQMRGNYGALRGLALPTFTNILHTLAPPISQHERLQIHITHDLVNYPALDPLIYEIFSRVMSQVEGGDLLVIQRGSESGQRRNSDGAYQGGIGSQNGWNNSSWWRENDAIRNLGAVKGLVEGTKLARVSAESYAVDFFSARGGIEEAAKQATEVLSETNPVRSSDIFLAVQAINHSLDADLFAASASVPKDKEEEAQPDELVSFAIYLHDPVHSIALSTVSQTMPRKWADWIDAKSTAGANEDPNFVPDLPEEIIEIIESDGIDPREWVAEWMEETLSLSVGVVAQRYVARRMGVGEGSIGRVKRREKLLESGAGEAARAI